MPVFSDYDSSDKETLDLMRITEAVGWGKYGKPDQFRRDLESRSSEGSRVHVAKEGVKAVAAVEVLVRPKAAWKVDVNGVYLLSIAVDPAWQRREVAKPLGVHVLGQLKAAGYKSAVADVQWDNAASLKLTTSLGAQVQGPSPDAVQKLKGTPHLRVKFTL